MALGSGAKGANYSVVKNREKETNLTQLSLHLKAEVGLWVGGGTKLTWTSVEPALWFRYMI